MKYFLPIGDSMPELPSSHENDSWHLLLDAPAFCHADGSVAEEREAFTVLDRVVFAAVEHKADIVVIPMATQLADREKTAEAGSFAAYFQRGLDIWAPVSVTMQERFLCGFFARRNPLLDAFWSELRNVEAVELYDSVETLLIRMDGDPESLRTAREAYYNMRQDVEESAKSALFRDHLFRNLIQFLQPPLLHCFGNRARLSLGCIGGERAERWMDTLLPILDHNAMTCERG